MMSSDADRDSLQRWQRLEAILDDAFALPAGERADFLVRACGPETDLLREARELLEGMESPLPLLDLPVDHAVPGLVGELREALTAAEPSAFRGRRVGHYRVVELLGRGGMGVVYLAERADGQYERHVAVKLLPWEADSSESRGRFVRERQILATLQHPNIARLLDGGVTDEGTPYFVTDYVAGVPIDTFCAHADLSLADRLRLWLDVANAVQYAHRNLIVHRDLKPSNILVTEEGVPKLLDFGIAGLLGPDADAAGITRTGAVRLTPEYASPEQVRGEAVGTPSDVYQLGLLLYELLTGRRARRVGHGTPREIDGAFGTVPPLPSEALAAAEAPVPGIEPRDLKGDLDAIALQALRPEPEERYPSVVEFASDVQRFLDGHPVRARVPSRRYRLAKFARRHAAGLAASIAIALLLVGYAVTLTVQATRIARERDRARIEAASAERVGEFLASLFEVADPWQSDGSEPTVREILDRGAGRIDRELAADPEVRARLQGVAGRVYAELGVYAEARSLLEASVATQDSLGQGGPALARSLESLGELLVKLDDPAEGAAVLDRAARLRAAAGPDDSTGAAAHGLYLLGYARHQAGEPEAADSLFRLVAAGARPGRYGDSPAALRDMERMANILYGQQRYELLADIAREQLALAERLYGEAHPAVVSALTSLELARNGRPDLVPEGSYAERALAASRLVYDEPHESIATALRLVATSRTQAGDRDGAIAAHRGNVDQLRRLSEAGDPVIGSGELSLAAVLSQGGDADELAEAEAVARSALARLSSATGANSIMTAVAHHELGNVLGKRDPVEAEVHLDLALERYGTSPRLLARRTLLASLTLAELLGARGEDVAARERLESAFEATLPFDAVAELRGRVAGELASLWEAAGAPDRAAGYRALTASPGGDATTGGDATVDGASAGNATHP